MTALHFISHLVEEVEGTEGSHFKFRNLDVLILVLSSFSSAIACHHIYIQAQHVKLFRMNFIVLKLCRKGTNVLDDKIHFSQTYDVRSTVSPYIHAACRNQHNYGSVW
jgi:hypothetical protein